MTTRKQFNRVYRLRAIKHYFRQLFGLNRKMISEKAAEKKAMRFIQCFLTPKI